MPVILLLFFLFLTSAVPASAELPILHQLFFAYLPSSDYNFSLQEGSVLGAQTTSLSTSTQSSTTTKTITIAVLGDSMIDTLGAQIPSLNSALQSLYPNVKFKILNYGLGSSNIESGLIRLTEGYVNKSQQYPSLISNRPDIVVVESFSYNNFGNSQDGINKHWLNLGAITTTLKKELPETKIVLAATIAPNSVSFANGILNLTSLEKIERCNTIKLYLQNLINFATSQKFPLADAYHPSLSGNDGHKTYINPADNIHPSPSGATLFSNIVAQTIFDNKLID